LAELPPDRSLSRTAREAIGYRELLAYFAGALATLDDAFDEAVRRTRRFARRQRTWFGRDPRVQWIDGSRSVADLAADAVRVWRDPEPASRQPMSDLRLAKLRDRNTFSGPSRRRSRARPAVVPLCDRHRYRSRRLITIGPVRRRLLDDAVNADGGRRDERQRHPLWRGRTRAGLHQETNSRSRPPRPAPSRSNVTGGRSDRG
jgi:hypothetical protein